MTLVQLPVHPIQNDELGVDCPVRHTAVPLAECAACSRGWVVKVAAGLTPEVFCHVVEPPPPAAPSATPSVRDVMGRKALAVQVDLTIERLILLFVDEDLSAAPVVDEARRLVGVVSKSDLVLDRYDWAELRDEALSQRRGGDLLEAREGEDAVYVSELLRSRTVGDVMTRNAIVVSPLATVQEAAQRMASCHVHSLPVVSDSGVLLGMITALDVTAWVARTNPSGAR